ncbi:MAG: hypothetical protein IJH82_11240 [Lachnospiraceae bacterium]|nr:hypothetical protein [Lachnospiraceae bacterium]
MKGKDKCKILKELRSEIAKNNDIEYVVSECKHQGECRGTCPKCEAEVAYLERELEKRRTLGKKVVLAGLGIGVAATIGGCTNPVVDYVIEPVMDVLGIGAQPLSGAAETLEGDVTYTDPGEYEGEPTEVPSDEGDSEEIIELDGDVIYVPEDDSEEIIELDGDVEYIPEDESEDGSEEIEELAGEVAEIPD